MISYYKVSYRHEGCPEIQTISTTARSKEEAKIRAIAYKLGSLIEIVSVKKVSLLDII